MALREEQLRNELALMSETTSVGLVRIDRKGKILTANKAWYDVVRLTEDQAPERWVEAMHPEDCDWVIESWSKCVSAPFCSCHETNLTRISAGVSRLSNLSRLASAGSTAIRV